MDELKLVRQLLEEPPPLPQVVTEGRERVFGLPAGGTSTTRPMRRTALRRAFGLGLTGAAVAAALVVATLVLGAGTAPEGGDLAARGGSRNVLLAAAARAESAPATGTYWHVRTMFMTTRQQELGRGDNRYTVEQLSVNEEWTKRSGQSWRGRREWVRPKTAEDKAAWRRDGSPTEWCMENTEVAEPFCLHTAPGTAFVTRMERDDSFLVAETNELTFAQLQRLPEDPDALRAWVVDAVKNDLDAAASSDLVDFSVADVLSDLLVDVPVPPGTRAAAYRALADMPNVNSVGPTRDALGRAGIGIVIDGGDMAGVVVPDGDRFRAGELRRRLIIDPDTSHVLANQATINESFDPSSGTLILKVGWTDEEPHKPALP